MKPQRIEISYKTIVFTVIFLASLSLFWHLRSLLILLYICFIFMASISHSVARLEKLKIPRTVSIFIIYLLIVVILSFALAIIIPVLVDQTNSLIITLPQTLQNIQFFGTSAVDWSSQFKILETLPANIAKATVSVFSNLLSTFIVFMITFYFLLERKNIGQYSYQLLGSKGRDQIQKIITQLEMRLSHWVNAQIILMVVVGLLSYFGYLLLGLNYAIPLAIIAGLLEVVPNIGPTVAAVLAAIIGLTVSPLTAVLAIIWGTIVQQLENNFIVPKVMKEAVGINPLITLIALATGAKLGGVLGTVLAIPTLLFIETIIKVLNSKNT